MRSQLEDACCSVRGSRLSGKAGAADDKVAVNPKRNMTLVVDVHVAPAADDGDAPAVHTLKTRHVLQVAGGGRVERDERGKRQSRDVQKEKLANVNPGLILIAIHIENAMPDQGG